MVIVGVPAALDNQGPVRVRAGKRPDDVGRVNDGEPRQQGVAVSQGLGHTSLVGVSGLLLPLVDIGDLGV